MSWNNRESFDQAKLIKAHQGSSRVDGHDGLGEVCDGQAGQKMIEFSDRRGFLKMTPLNSPQPTKKYAHSKEELIAHLVKLIVDTRGDSQARKGDRDFWQFAIKAR